MDTVYAEEGSATRFVSETGRTMRGPFLHYWESHGALPSFGHPITDEIEEGGLLVQYFERARLEYHPENAGSEYEVLLGHLGLQLTSARDFPPATFIPPASSGINYFAETRHSLGGEFLDYWRLQGGLERFGYPISEELSETSTTDRRTYTVQYFERARFEFHPDNVEPYRVLLGQLGREMLRLRDKASRFVQVVDGQLVSGQSLTPLKLKGFNYFPRDYGWTDFGAWPTDRVEHELEQAERLGANTLRVFIRYDAFGGAAEGWRKQEGFANFVRMAKAHGLYLLVSLFDGSRKVPQTGWDNWPAPGTPEDAQDKAYLAAVITPWKNETTILGWDVYNEPDHVTELEWRWDEHRANRVYWLARMATEVRRLDPNHPLTVGVAIADSNLLPGRGGMNMLDIVDFVSVHYYKRNYGGKSAASVLRDLKKLTRKPILIEEAGESTLDNPDGDAEQARFLAQVMRDAIETDTSGVLIWTLYDFPTHSTNSEGYYGVLRADDTPKPAAAIFSQH
ncbi:MAG: hypothetical protein ABI670_19550 [Chloroflexota bacterium]